MSSTPSDVIRVPARTTNRFLHVEWQRRRPDIEPQLNGRRDFVHVLTAWSGGAAETLFDVLSATAAHGQSAVTGS
jgi:hypothetical protein